MAKFLGDAPLFTEHDLAISLHPLDRLFRRMCIAMKLTQSGFRSKYFAGSLRQGKSYDHSGQDHNNIRKAMTAANGITFNTLHKIIDCAFDQEVVEVRIVTKDNEGNLYSYSSEDAADISHVPFKPVD